MKKLIFILSLIVSLNSFAQKTKTEKLFKSNMAGKILMMTTFDEENNVVDKNIVLLNRDSRYSAIYESIIIYLGSADDLLGFLKEVEIFCEENEPDMQTKIHNRTVNYVKMLGYKAVYIYDEEDLGYHIYRRKDIIKLRKWMENWINKN